jgi:Uma2 family endonuclease
MIQSPLIVVEVLSPSTESYDRTEKFARYMLCPTLEVSMLVSQEEQHIEVYRRSMGWKQERFSAGQTVKLEQLDLELPVGPILQCEPADAKRSTKCVAGSQGSIYEGVL